MTTTAGDLVTAVRSNINEASTATDPQRSDTEILYWLDQGIFDYMHKVPQQHFPELTTNQTFSGSQCGIPTDYLFFHSLTVTHTISGTTVTEISDCWVVSPGNTYYVQNYVGALGAWCQVSGKTFSTGPQVVSGTLTYVKEPTHLTTASATFDVGHEHESAIVFYATSMALSKVNDADAAGFMERYNDSIAGKVGKKESEDIERA
jgi:hypothetical protein